MKKILLLVALFMSLAINAQDSDKTVTLTVSGTGKTLEEAKTNALRSAIEQAFGTFISSKTEILNDNLIKDEIVSVANGNIQKFEVISEVKIPDGGYATSLKAIVSISKLISFVESKGGVLDLKGGEFSFNVKKEEFYANTEYEALRSFISSRLQGQIFYDYTLLSNSPIVDGESYSIELQLGIKANNNLYSFFSDFFNLLDNISLDNSTINFRKESNLQLYQVEVKDGVSYYLRNNKSFDIIRNIDRLLFLKAGDFEIISNPKFKVPTAESLIKSNVVVNNFIIINRTESPNPGVYWSWLPYEYSASFQKTGNQSTRSNKNHLTITTNYLKNITKQSDLNRYSEHMNPVINNKRTDYNIVIMKKLSFTRNDFEKIESINVIPKLNNFE